MSKDQSATRNRLGAHTEVRRAEPRASQNAQSNEHTRVQTCMTAERMLEHSSQPRRTQYRSIYMAQCNVIYVQNAASVSYDVIRKDTLNM